MKMKFQLFVAGLVFLVAANVSIAQDQGVQGGSGGGLSSLFKGIGDVVNAVGQGHNKGNANNIQDAGGPQSNTDSNPQILDILKIEASKDKPLFENCSEDYFRQSENQRVLGPFQRAEYNMAAPGADSLAGVMARCAIKDQANLAQWSNRVGLMLAFSAISWKNAGVGGTSQVAATAGRAVTLLSFAKLNNIDGASQTLDKMKESGFAVAEEKISVKQEQGEIALSTSTAEVAKKFKGNVLAFHKNYIGKVLQVTGPVRLVGEGVGKPPGAHVILTGIVKDRDDVSPSDEIMCEITDSKGVTSAADLELGKIITASGLYDPKIRSYGLYESQVVLHDCQIR